jgi:error-prone DNA polymerase
LENQPPEGYAELHCLSNFSFLRGASRPEELVWRAAQLGYRALAITDECSLAGVVKAHVAAKQCRLHLIIGSELQLEEGLKIIVLAPDRSAYSELSGLITLARRRSPKGEYQVSLRDITFHLKRCLLIWIPNPGSNDHNTNHGRQLRSIFKHRLWLGVNHYRSEAETERYSYLLQLASDLDIAMVACGDVHMHVSQRKRLHDVLTATRYNTCVDQLGRQRHSNSQRHLRSLEKISLLYPPALLRQSLIIAQQCTFNLSELRYEYPQEVVPKGMSAREYLRERVGTGARQRWPLGVPAAVKLRIAHEFELIEELEYEYYFLTVYDIVRFARKQKILCQGRGSAANSVVCYCLFITEISPENISLLFERFISRERDEPPDIDVDFEHERREEVIQYIYDKYSRKRAALAATVITYRSRSAVRDVGKALGLDPIFIDDLAKSLAWWDRKGDLKKRFQEQGLSDSEESSEDLAELFHQLVQEIIGFPRHLSQHVGGFVITRSQISTLVPVENASMADRTVIQWDKEDIEALGLLKVDILALGMLSAIRKSLHYVNSYDLSITGIADVPAEDPRTYSMLQKADSVGVFQIESRAQMSMLPRLKPRCFYDLVIQIAIVRPGPIQGDMVHPYLRRRQGLEPVTYPSPAIKSVLERTLGVPIFQEQAIKLAMVAAGFSGGEADQLRRAMASWGKNGNLAHFEDKLVEGMCERGYSLDFAKRLFEQIKGFGGYGFPESHSASFALLAYVSAWLKCHHPAAFYCGLLNSQPMGFYTPSQLIQDARRHEVVVEPIDVLVSDWDHRLCWPDILNDRETALQPSLRLGLRLVKGFGREAAERIVAARRQQAFGNVADLRQRASLDRGDMEALAAADALAALSGHRYQSQWQIMALEQPRPLLASNDYQQLELNDGVELPSPKVAEEVLSDYRSTGLSLRPHPMALLREQRLFQRCKRHSDLAGLNNGRFVRVAGLVTGRQRPGSASGVLFLTLEDETGNTNVIIWKSLQERSRQALLTSQLLLVKGVVETKDGVVHLIAGELIDHSDQLKGLATRSREFH